MILFWENLKLLLGGKPKLRKVEADFTPEAWKIHQFKRTPEQLKIRKEALKAERFDKPSSKKWTYIRWASIIFINLIFVVSFQFDVQLVEGALTASRVLGFHFADLSSALQVMLAHKHVVMNLLIGTLTVFFFWWLVGGRSFCSWACPYHLLAEFAEMIHLKFKKRGWARDLKPHRSLRVVVFVVFMSLAFITGYTVFESISPVGITSRALIYGLGAASIWVVALLLIEVFLSRRFWCRYICPIGLTYAAVGMISPVRVRYDLESCLHEGECLKVCMVPHVLQCTKMGQSPKPKLEIMGDCTRCGMCVDACPTGALKYKVQGLDILM